MSQSTLIALAIVLLFVVYVAARGRLPAYMQVFGLARGEGSDSSSSGGGTGFSWTTPFSGSWWQNFLRPWTSGGTK